MADCTWLNGCQTLRSRFCVFGGGARRDWVELSSNQDGIARQSWRRCGVKQSVLVCQSSGTKAQSGQTESGIQPPRVVDSLAQSRIAWDFKIGIPVNLTSWVLQLVISMRFGMATCSEKSEVGSLCLTGVGVKHWLNSSVDICAHGTYADRSPAKVAMLERRKFV